MRRTHVPLAWRSLAPAVLLAVCAGCSDAARSAPSQTEPLDALFETERTIRLAAPATNPIGQVTAIRDWHGQLAVVDYMQGDVKLFDASGSFVRVIGGAGDGPGEFRGPVDATVLPNGDLAVIDQEAARVTRFDATGQFRSMWSIPGGLPGGVEALGGGETVILSGKLYTTPVHRRDAESRDGLHIFTVDGRHLSSFRPPPPMTVPQERSFSGVRFGLLDDVVVAGQYSRNIIDYRDLASGREWSDTIGGHVYRPPDWDEAKRVRTGDELLRFSDRAMWLHRIVPFGDHCRYVAAFATKRNGEYVYHYVIHGINGVPGGISAQTPVRILSRSGERLYATRVRDDGEVDLLVLRPRDPVAVESGTESGRCSAGLPPRTEPTEAAARS